MQEENKHELRIGRVLVAIDSSTESLHALEAAAQLAAHMQVDIQGLFVENPNLMRLEELNSSRRIHLPQGFGGQIEQGSIQRELEAHASRARDLLGELSEQLQLHWDFQVERGSMRTKLAEASGDTDLVVVESEGRIVRSAMRLEASTRRAAESVDRPVLYLQHGVRAIESIVAVYDGSPQAERVLDAAVNLMAAPLSMLTVVLSAESREDADALREQAEQSIGSAGVRAHFRRVSPERVEWLGRALREFHGDILIHSAGGPMLEHNDVQDVLDEVSCPVLLIR